MLAINLDIGDVVFENGRNVDLVVLLVSSEESRRRLRLSPSFVSADAYLREGTLGKDTVMNPWLVA